MNSSDLNDDSWSSGESRSCDMDEHSRSRQKDGKEINYDLYLETEKNIEDKCQND